jgi:hypothetical protein
MACCAGLFRRSLAYDPLIHPTQKEWPKPKWQTMINSQDLLRAIEDLETIMDLLEQSLKVPATPKFLLMEAVDVP